jgi:thiol-disulfide isomerase/thioredoxin
MRYAYIVAILCLSPLAAADPTWDEPAPPLDQLLARARDAHKPLLIDFAAVWCGPCKRLDKELARPENQKLLEGFVFHKYDAERGEGAQVAARYEVVGYPTLLVVDEKGVVLERQVGLQSEKASAWLETQARALRSENELLEQVRKNPGDVDALWLLANRAQARGELAAMRSWLSKIESGDADPRKEAAAEAAWTRIESELAEKQQQEVRAAALAYSSRYPLHSQQAIKALAGAGADRATLEKELARAVEASGKDDDLNGLVYLALSVGAFDAAVLAGEKQVQLFPGDANAMDSLSEAYNYRGEKEKALANQRQALELKDLPAEQKAALEANMKRFQTGAPTTDVPPRPVLASPLEPSAQAARPKDATAAARTLYTKNAALIASKCAAKKKGLDEVYVRIRVGDGKVDKIDVLEPAAPAALKKCLAAAIRDVKVPLEQKSAKVTLSLAL